MSAALHLATPDDIDRLVPMMADYHAFEGIDVTEAHRREAVMPLLEGSPLGAVYLIGPRRAPVGYIAFAFGWSLELGGMEGFIDEFYLRESVRGRGIGGEVLGQLIPRLEAAGLRALHLEVAPGNTRASGLYARLGFQLRDGYHLMTRTA